MDLEIQMDFAGSGEWTLDRGGTVSDVEIKRTFLPCKAGSQCHDHDMAHAPGISSKPIKLISPGPICRWTHQSD